jgi:peptidyl-dipeptidase Dcp
MDPVLTNATDRRLREQVWRTYYGRGDSNGEQDNKPIISEILRLRAERAALLGYETHAHWRLEVAMAKTPETAMELMLNVWPKARARALEEIADMQRMADNEAAVTGAAPLTIEPWDHRFYAEKVRKGHYDLDFKEALSAAGEADRSHAVVLEPAVRPGLHPRRGVGRGPGAGVPSRRPGVAGHR